MVRHLFSAVVLHVRDKDTPVRGRAHIHNIHTDAVTGDDLAFLHPCDRFLSDLGILVHHCSAIGCNLKQIFLTFRLQRDDLGTRGLQNFCLKADIIKIKIGNHHKWPVTTRFETGYLRHNEDLPWLFLISDIPDCNSCYIRYY